MTIPTNKTHTTKPGFMRRQGGIRGATPVRPHFSPELASLDPKSNADRLIAWMQKRQFVDPSRISVSRVRKSA